MTNDFKTMQQAFDYCREADKPVIVTVDGYRWKLFPSGKALYIGIESLSPTASTTLNAPARELV